MLTLRNVVLLQCLVLMLQGKLIAGINSRVQLYDWQLQKDSSRGLVAGAGQSGLVLALYLACRGDFIVVGKPLNCCVWHFCPASHCRGLLHDQFHWSCELQASEPVYIPTSTIT